MLKGKRVVYGKTGWLKRFARKYEVEKVLIDEDYEIPDFVYRILINKKK